MSDPNKGGTIRQAGAAVKRAARAVVAQAEELIKPVGDALGLTVGTGENSPARVRLRKRVRAMTRR